MRRDALDRAATERVIDSARRFVLRLSGAINSLKTYPLEHPSLQFSYRGIGEALSEMVDLLGATMIFVAPDRVQVGELEAEIDQQSHDHMRLLTQWLLDRGSKGIRVDARVTQEQVQEFVGILVAVEGLEPEQAREEANRALAGRGLGHLRLEEAATTGSQPVAQNRSEEPARLVLETYLEIALLAEDLVLNGPRSGTMAALEDAIPVLVDVLLPRTQAIPVLLELSQGIPYETRHAANSTILAVAIGARLGLERAALIDLGLAVATMDLGMRVLPPEVRSASRELHPSELATLRMHPVETVRAHLLGRGFDVALRRRVLVAMEQHLGVRRDGYPAVHRWPEQHLFTRIASTCDAFDALCSSTAWRKGLTPEQALSQLSPPSDSSHDPMMVAELCAVVGFFPPKCPVRLSDGRGAVVVQSRGPAGPPLVRVDGEKSTLDLGQRDGEGRLKLSISEVRIADARR